MTATEQSAPTAITPEGVLAAVDALVPSLPELLEGANEARRLPDAAVSAIRATGINRLVLPTELGGMAAAPSVLAQALERLATVDGSAAWCTAIGAGGKLFGGYLPEAGARQVFADPDATTAGIFATLGKLRPSDAGPRLDGRWPFSSNSLHSSWIGVGAFVEDDAGEVAPNPRMVFIEASAVTIDETWDALGLQATGSHDVVVHDAPVDFDRSCEFSDTPWAEGTLWQLPPFMTFAPCLGTVVLGVARGAIDVLTRHLHSGAGTRRGALVEDPLAMVDIAEAGALLQGARAGLYEALDMVWETAASGGDVDRRMQAAVFMAVHHVCDVSMEITATIHRLGGGRAAYAASPLSRALRDVETARQHVMFARNARVGFARNLLGIETPMPPLIP